MASNQVSDEPYPAPPASILSKGGAGKGQTKSWGKTAEAVRFAKYVSEGQGDGMF